MTYIFRVMPFFVHASVFRAPGTNPPGYKKLNELVAKEYNYIYTGKNNNVLKFDIQINQLFHSGMNSAPLKNTESANSNDPINVIRAHVKVMLLIKLQNILLLSIETIKSQKKQPRAATVLKLYHKKLHRY